LIFHRFERGALPPSERFCRCPIRRHQFLLNWSSADGVAFNSCLIPYFDFDWGWALLLAADETFVYILTGGDKHYQTWFKVEKTRYDRQWEKAITLSCQAYSL
jgi:hypothetical protein